MKKYVLGILLGFVTGVLDAIPMMLNEGMFIWQEAVASVVFWIAVGFFIAVGNIPKPGIGRGLFVSSLVFIPVFVSMSFIGFKSQEIMLSIIVLNLGLGAILGHLLYVFGE